MKIWNNKSSELLKIEEQKLFDYLDTSLENYVGRGKPSKPTTGGKHKTGYTGICSIDSLLNLLRNSIFKNEENHKFCSHVERCALCIVRSAISKIELNKEKKCYVNIPEIIHNLNIFLGESYCVSCYKPFDNQEEKNVHKCPLLKPAEISLKHVLDTFISQENIRRNFTMDIVCTKCNENISPFTEGYFKIKQGNDGNLIKISNQINRMINHIENSHHKISKQCKSGNIKLENFPTNLFIMMEQNSVKEFQEVLSFNGTQYKYGGQIDFEKGLLSNHFSSIIEQDDSSVLKCSGKQCTYKSKTGKKCKDILEPDVSKSVLMLYTLETAKMPSTDLRYKQSAIKFFSYDPEMKRKKYNPEN